MEVIATCEDKKFYLDLPVRFFNKAQRRKDALKFFSIYFSAALISIFIPVLHFALVPGFLITTFIGTRKKLKCVSSIDLSGQVCPCCQAKLNEDLVYQEDQKNFSLVFCFECRRYLKFNPPGSETNSGLL